MKKKYKQTQQQQKKILIKIFLVPIFTQIRENILFTKREKLYKNTKMPLTKADSLLEGFFSNFERRFQGR